MSENKLTATVRDFYDKMAISLELLCEVNSHQLVKKYNDIISQLHEETAKRYYGSGYLIPDLIEGAQIVDFGCGSGSLVFVLSKLVGQNGFVTGIDITPNLILESKKQIKYHTEKWGYSKANIEFRLGNLEKFDDIALKDESQDVVVSNGVLCLCPDQRLVLTNAYRLLKDGGEFCLSDVYADRDRPEDKKDDPTLFCLGTTGSMKWDELGPLSTEVGFTKAYLTGAAPVEFKDMAIHEQVAKSEFVCAEYRLFRLPKGAKGSAMEVTYLGNISGHEEAYKWDINTVFKTGEPVAVDSDLATILNNTRYKSSFKFKDITSNVKTPTLQNPFAYLDDMRAQGHTLTPVYKV